MWNLELQLYQIWFGEFIVWIEIHLNIIRFHDVNYLFSFTRDLLVWDFNKKIKITSGNSHWYLKFEFICFCYTVSFLKFQLMYLWQALALSQCADSSVQDLAQPGGWLARRNQEAYNISSGMMIAGNVSKSEEYHRNYAGDSGGSAPSSSNSSSANSNETILETTASTSASFEAMSSPAPNFKSYPTSLRLKLCHFNRVAEIVITTLPNIYETTVNKFWKGYSKYFF